MNPTSEPPDTRPDGMPPGRAPSSDLVHAINNLLGVIHVQVAVARAAGTVDAATEALRLIEQAASRTQQALVAFRRRTP